jgi:hypothetical protein
MEDIIVKIECNGIKVQPISGTETLALNMFGGVYTKSQL